MDMQKFKRGDVVHIAADLGQSMSHFENDIDAIVIGSYADQFGGNDTHSYTLMFLSDGNKVSWYEEHQLTFLYHGGEELITKINKERDERHKKDSDLDWIVNNWKEIRTSIPSASMTKLMLLIGITKPSGTHGEGIDWYNHAKYTMKCLDAVLLTGDIKLVEKFIAEFPKVNEFIFSSDFYNGNNELRKPEFIP